MATLEPIAPGCADEVIALVVNGVAREVVTDPSRRLSRVLRDDLGLTGTKVGCDAGDCGACTVLLDGAPVCSCLVSVAQACGHEITTVEGLAARPPLRGKLQESFLQHGAAQCGACTPGMLVAATALLEQNPTPSEREILDAIGGVLCRCTGYRKIIEAIAAAGPSSSSLPATAAVTAVGQRLVRLDGQRKVEGSEIFGADQVPEGALGLRVLRSPHARAEFHFGDLDTFVREHPGIVAVLTARDVPGVNCFGVIPRFADQPVFAEGEARFRGEAVAAVVGDDEALEGLDLAEVPVTWNPLPAVVTIDEAVAPDAPRIHAGREDNVLVGGRVVRGDVEAALSHGGVIAEIEVETGFIEHAYIEPEAGFARCVGDTVEVQACTQAPYMDRDDLAAILGLPKDKVRVIPTAVGGGFGSKLDLSLQPFLALAAWKLERPVRMVYSRAESMLSTTKRHPARMKARAAVSEKGAILALDFSADFNTGAYSSWGPTVAARVPVHASGPYLVPNYRAITCAIHTNLVPAGAFRGFGVPQTAIAVEQLYDELAGRIGMDPLEFRIQNALTNETPTVTGQVLGEGVGIRQCLESLRLHWMEARARAEAFNREASSPLRRGVGVAGMWYGCGNTSLPNPSTIRVGLKRDGRVSLHQGAVDIGQGSNTIVTQICADALGVPVGCFDLVSGDTALSPDCGKTSASRQTFVTGKAAYMAGQKLRGDILRLARAEEPAEITLRDAEVVVRGNGRENVIRLGELPLDSFGYVLTAEATFDPPTKPLDENGQGIPYAVYGFGAHMAQVEVDSELGTVHVLKVIAAHDVGRAINPTLIEGQIEGGVAQGLGMALMEEFIPGRNENLHDYLIPSAGDIPPVKSILIEDPSSIGPFGAKGIGEQAVIPTAPAILNAIYHAVGVRVKKLPAAPDCLRAAIFAKARGVHG